MDAKPSRYSDPAVGTDPDNLCLLRVKSNVLLMVTHVIYITFQTVRQLSSPKSNESFA